MSRGSIRVEHTLERVETMGRVGIFSANGGELLDLSVHDLELSGHAVNPRAQRSHGAAKVVDRGLQCFGTLR